MKSRDAETPMSETKKSRFKIEKLEERIAPHHLEGHYRGKDGNCTGGHYKNKFNHKDRC